MPAEKGSPMVIRQALSGDLPQLLALYPHLNPADPIPSLEVAQRRLEALQKYPGCGLHWDRGCIDDCFVHAGGYSQLDARRPGLWAD